MNEFQLVPEFGVIPAKSNNWVWWVVVFAVLAFVGYLFFRSKKETNAFVKKENLRLNIYS